MCLPSPIIVSVVYPADLYPPLRLARRPDRGHIGGRTGPALAVCPTQILWGIYVMKSSIVSPLFAVVAGRTSFFPTAFLSRKVRFFPAGPPLDVVRPLCLAMRLVLHARRFVSDVEALGLFVNHHCCSGFDSRRLSRSLSSWLGVNRLYLEPLGIVTRVLSRALS